MPTAYPRKTIKIAGNSWQIYLVPPRHTKLEKGNWGRCWLAERKIYISNRLGNRNFKLTLTHELLHALHSEIGWDSKLVKKFRRSGNERLVDGMALFLSSFIRPSLFRFNQKRQKERDN